MFDPKISVDDCQIQASQCFEGHYNHQFASGMEDQSPTPPLSRPGSSILTACDRELASPPDASPSWTLSNAVSSKPEYSQHFAVDLQQALGDVDSCHQRQDEDLRQYVAIRDIQPPYYESPPSQFFQYPPYPQAPAYYQSYQFSPLSPAPSATMGSPAMQSQFPQTTAWSPQSEAYGTFEEQTSGMYHAAMSPEGRSQETLCDKPYAQLIYDALMQAPGHRMMLREIYDWFQRHTHKPAESGTNGWQNSIRHNLSMNQAFENDKSDQGSNAAQKQKFNSVWVLTEYAIRHGVQSTTRYRKTGSGKRLHTNKIPAPLRQRSGAKGGKAARRAAQLRKKESLLHQDCHASPSLEYPRAPMYDYEDGTYDGAESSDTFSALDSTTSFPDIFGGDPGYEPRFGSEARTTLMHRSNNPACTLGIGDAGQTSHEIGYQSASDLTLEEMLRAHQDSTASNLST